MAIRRTFYTGPDAFSDVMSADDVRQWLRGLGSTHSSDGQSVDDLDEETLALWFAAVSLHEAQQRAKHHKYINVRRDDGEWVSILTGQVVAVGAKVVSDNELPDDEIGTGEHIWTEGPDFVH